MPINLRPALALIYLLAVLLLGGASAAGFAGNLALQLSGAGLIALTLWSEPPAVGTATGLKPVLFALAAVLLLQFFPLPPFAWEAMPGREPITRGFELAGLSKPWLTYSLDPWRSLQSMAWGLPAIAVFVSMRASNAPATRHVIWLVAGVAYLSVVLAAIQAWIGSSYFYTVTNRGNGVGFFANSNHFATLMLIAVPLIAGDWLHHASPNKVGQKLTRELMLAALLAPLAIGLILADSQAGLLLSVFLLSGVVLLIRPKMRINWFLVGALLLVAATGLIWLLGSGLVENDLMAKSGTIGISRGEFLANGSDMLRSFAPFGTGIGTFGQIYPWFEDVGQVGRTYANHAHNDLLEFLIETGVFGLALFALFLNWFLRAGWLLWNADRSTQAVALAATLGIAAVLMHSLVDYPLRTAAISSLLALCCVLAKRPAPARGAQANPGPGAGKRETMLQI